GDDRLADPAAEARLGDLAHAREDRTGDLLRGRLRRLELEGPAIAERIRATGCTRREVPHQRRVRGHAEHALDRADHAGRVVEQAHLCAPADLERTALRDVHHGRNHGVAVVLDQLDAIADEDATRRVAGAEVDTEDDIGWHGVWL